MSSLENIVSFAEYGLFYRALLQKRPIILRSLLIVATPYQSVVGYYHSKCVCVNVRTCVGMKVYTRAAVDVRAYIGVRV